MFKKRNKKINSERPLRVWFWSLVFTFIFCLFSYGYCVRGAILSVVNRQNIESQLSSLNSKVLSLESEYIKAKNEITLEKAYSMGFVSVTEQKFVTRDVRTQGLSLVTSGL